MINRKQGTTIQMESSSPIRKVGAYMKSATESRIIQSELYSGKIRKHDKRAMKIVERMNRGMAKAASVGGTDVKNAMPAFYHPEFEPSTLLMPRERREVDAWCRYFYKYDALVSTAIDAHAELPISTIRMALPNGHDKDKNRKIKDEYEEMCSTEYLDLFNKLLQIGVEYYKLGNVVPYSQWSSEKNKWIKLTLLDPDYVEIEKLQFTNKMRIDMVPNDNLRRIVNNGPNHPKTGILFQSLPEDIIQLIRMNKNIPLNTNPYNGSHATHLAYKMADYDLWGTGLIERNFKALVYKDRLRQSQDAIAARHLTPKHLVWAENMGNVDVNTIREQVDSAMSDPDYAIITNFELHWELIGTSTGLMQLESEWNWLTEELLIGLMINKSFLLGEGSYANGQTVLQVMNQRYSIYRERLESYIVQYLFKPMAVMNDWAEYEDGTVKKEKKIKYLFPKIKWNKLDFVDDTQHKQMLSQMVTQGQVDLETWLECFGLDPETIKERLKRLEGTPLDINYFEEQRAIASEVGRALAPAITKLRAKQRGIELPPAPPEGGGMGGFASEESGMMKTAESREERRHEREMRRIRRKKEKIVDTLQVKPPLELPPRTDLQKPHLFEANETEIKLDKSVMGDAHSDSYEDVPILDPKKTAEIKQKLEAQEQVNNDWVSKLHKAGIDPNTKRAMITMEDDLIALNGNGTSKERMAILRLFLPQIYASKIQGNDTLMKKTEAAKHEFNTDITTLSYLLESGISRSANEQESRQSVRATLEKAFLK
jgi:hypothetical protein